MNEKICFWEQSVLGSLLKPFAPDDLLSIAVSLKITEQSFSKEEHQICWTLLVQLKKEGLKPDPVLVCERLQRTDLLPYFCLLLDVSILAAFSIHCQQLKQREGERKLQQQLLESAAENDPDLLDRIARIQGGLQGLQEEYQQAKQTRASDLLKPTLKKLQELWESGEPEGLRLPWSDLDSYVNSLIAGALVVIGARPAMGKTSFALQIATYTAREKPVAVFSLEMSQHQVMKRILTQLSRVQIGSGDFVNSSKLVNQVHQGASELSNLKLHIFDNSSLCPLAVRGEVKKIELQEKEKIGLIVIDYLQLMSSDLPIKDRRLEIESISRGLKVLAQDLNVPVLVLSQLSRNLERRTDKRPIMADLRESGSIEQDAESIFFLYRDAVYNEEADPALAEAIIAKQRDGETAVVPLRFEGAITSFDD